MDERKLWVTKEEKDRARKAGDIIPSKTEQKPRIKPSLQAFLKVQAFFCSQFGDQNHDEEIHSMSDFGKLQAQANSIQHNELDIFLVFENPLSEALEVNWKVHFPFLVTPLEEASGTVRLEPEETATKSWTTSLTGLTRSQWEAAWGREIEVVLQLTAGEIFLQDGITGTLKELRKSAEQAHRFFGLRVS